MLPALLFLNATLAAYLIDRDLPKLSELGRMPPAFVIRDGLAFNRRHAEWLEARKDEQPWCQAWRTWERDNDKLYRFWDHVRDAQIEWYQPVCRRKSLAAARAMVTKREWFCGDWPLFFPIEWFRVE